MQADAAAGLELIGRQVRVAEQIGKPYATSWSTLDATGRRFVTRVSLNARGEVSSVRFYDADGNQRIWDVHQDRVWLESTTDPIGEERKTAWMVKKE